MGNDSFLNSHFLILLVIPHAHHEIVNLIEITSDGTPLVIACWIVLKMLRATHFMIILETFFHLVTIVSN
jgi:hypothetical protein